jgi:hypothetical protein
MGWKSMSMRSKLPLAGAVVVLASMLTASPALAAPPPPGYPTQQIMATAKNPGFADIPIRRGFWDADAGQGFGFDKAWNYHNITTLSGQQKVMLSPTRKQQGNGSWRLTAYAQKEECVTSNGSTTCRIVEEIPVVGVYNPRTFDEYFGWPVRGVLGEQTMYCDQGGVVKCPSWVWIALQNLGTSANESRMAQSGFSVEQGLNAEQREDQIEQLQTAEMQELEDQVLAGQVVLTGSYTPSK